MSFSSQGPCWQKLTFVLAEVFKFLIQDLEGTAIFPKQLLL